MKVLIVKTSSMGDVIHTLPAIKDAANAIPNIEFDWVVEKAFRDIPNFSPYVKNTITIEWRKWRKNLYSSFKSDDYKNFKSALCAKKYDLIIDAQGLLKSAVIAKMARGPIAGFNFSSAREKLACLFYQKKYGVEKTQHAIDRVRQLFAKALGYAVPEKVPDYGIDKNALPKKPMTITEPFFIFLHGTTWDTKHYPEPYWQELIKRYANKKILLPWGNDNEKARAERLAKNNVNALVLPKCSIAEMASLLADAEQVIAVDTGLGHLSAALATKTVSLYGPTNPTEIGTKGFNQTHVQVDFKCAPCKLRKCKLKEIAVSATPPRNDDAAHRHYDHEQSAKQEAIHPPCFKTISPKKIKELP